MESKLANTQLPINELLAKRWSPRALDPNKPISEDDLTKIFEAARWAPSCFGDQPWRYIVFNRYVDQTAWDKALNCLAKKNQLWAQNAPVLLLAVAHEKFSQNGKPNRWAQYDTGAASENLCLQATALGFCAHQMGGFDLKKTQSEFNIPADFTPMAMIALGYQCTVDHLAEDFQEAEVAPRSRNPLNQHFFLGEWGQGVSE